MEDLATAVYKMVCVKFWLRCIFFLVFVQTLSSCSSIGNFKGDAGTDSSLDENRIKFDFFFYEALSQIAQLNYDSAFDLLEYCLGIKPESAATRYELSKLYMMVNDRTQPERLMREVVDIESGNYWYWVLLASYYEKHRQYDKAIEIYESMSSKFPSRTDILLSLVDLYGAASDFENMLAVLNRLEMREGKSEQITLSKFHIHNQINQPDSAYSEIMSLIEEYPNDSRYGVLLGNFLILNGRDEEALELFLSNLDRDPSDINSRLALLDYYSMKREDSLLFEQIDYVLGSKETDFELKRQVMITLVATAATRPGNSGLIEEKFRIALEGDQKNSSILEMYARFLISNGVDLNLLTPVFKQIFEIQPDNKWALLNLLEGAIHDSQRDEIIQLCSLALQYSPEEITLYYYMAAAFSQKEMFDESVSVIRQGLAQISTQSDSEVISELFSLLGDIYYERAEYDSSFEAYDSAIIYNSQNYPVMNNYAYLLSLHKCDLDKAEKMSLKTIIVEPNNHTYLDTYSWILFQKGSYEEAKNYIERALENGGKENPDILEHSGDINYMLGNVEKAVLFWNSAVDYGNTSDNLQRKIREKYISR